MENVIQSASILKDAYGLNCELINLSYLLPDFELSDELWEFRHYLAGQSIAFAWIANVEESDAGFIVLVQLHVAIIVVLFQPFADLLESARYVHHSSDEVCVRWTRRRDGSTDGSRVTSSDDILLDLREIDLGEISLRGCWLSWWGYADEHNKWRWR